ncbi:copper transporter [Actinomycetospora sp. NBC_00405]|uniref:copper transporter n=1 Tax=Actinomycetospora sp. NBC_00405 TaxID=2975952 RepID=UPI002E1F9ABA
MMSLRYHVVSIAAILLALALGVVLGASALSGRVLGALTTDRDELAGQVVALRGERAAVDTRLQATERLVAAGAPSTVAGVLPGRGVAVVAAPGADPADVATVSELVTRAGGRVTGRLALTDAALAPDRADALRALVPRLLPAGAQLPTTTDTGALTGSLLGSLLVARPDGMDEQTTGPETRTALRALGEAGYVQAPDALDPAPGELALVVTGGGGEPVGHDPARDSTLARMTGELDRVGAGAVLAGRTGSGAVTAVRNDSALRSGLSTVDGLEGPSSQVATVLALREQADGRTGLYGPVAGTFTPQTAPAP